VHGEWLHGSLRMQPEQIFQPIHFLLFYYAIAFSCNSHQYKELHKAAEVPPDCLSHSLEPLMKTTLKMGNQVLAS
jgi:hypothetical protein